MRVGHTAVLFVGLGVLLLSASAGVAAGQQDSVSLKWRYDIDSGDPSSPTVVNDTVYFGTQPVSGGIYTDGNGSVYALDAETGQMLWNFTTGGPVVGPPTVVNRVLYVGSEDKRVYALDARTGEEIWNHTAKGRSFTPTVWNHTVYFYSTNGKFTSTTFNEGTVYALDAETGERLWEYTTNRPMSSAPTVVDGVVHIGSFDGNLYALDAETGERIWSYSVGSTPAHRVLSSPTVFGDKVYIGTAAPGKHNFYALEASDGSVVWNFTTDASLFYTPTAADGKVYVVSEDSVYALDTDDGSVIWNRTTGHAPSSAPTVAGDRLYVGTGLDAGRNLYSFNTDTGGLVLNYSASHSVSAPIVLDGVIYFEAGSTLAGRYTP